jgi:large-conductance mechanosensitive channel
VALVTLPFSITICHAALIVFLFAWLAERRWKDKFIIIKNSVILKLILMFLLVQLLGLFYTSNQPAGWFALEKKIFLFLVPLAIATTQVKFTPREIKIMLYLFVLSCMVGVLICFGYAASQLLAYQHGTLVSDNTHYLDSSPFDSLNSTSQIPWMLFSYVGFSSAVGIHPSYFSMYLAFCICFLMSEMMTNSVHLRTWKGLGLSAVIILFTLTIVLLSSRIMVISTIFIYLTLAIYFIVKQRFVISTIIAFILIAVVVFLNVNPVSRYRSIQEITGSVYSIRDKNHYETATEIRTSLWWLSWKSLYKINLLSGTGTGDVVDTIRQTGQEHEISNILDTYDPHNQYFHTLIGSGVFGLLILLTWLLFAFIVAWNRQDYLFAAFGFLFAALCITESAFELQKGVVFFAIFYSLLDFQRETFRSQVFTLKLFGARN